jgi:hypothetical protein
MAGSINFMGTYSGIDLSGPYLLHYFNLGNQLIPRYQESN